MKKIIKYECEVCNRQYDDEESALECEAIGVFDPSTMPKYVMYQNIGGFYDKMTFCTVEWRPDSSKHFGSLGSWACRDTYAGDNLKQLCSGGSCCRTNDPSPQMEPVKDFRAPHFKRMCAHLKSLGLPLLCWDGEKTFEYKE